MKYSLLMLVAILFGLAYFRPVAAAKKPKKEELVDQVRNAIQLGIKYLRSQQLSDGSWEIDDFSKTRPSGWTCLTMLALLNAGVGTDDKMIRNGLAYLRKQEPSFTYVRALQTMVFAEAAKSEDSERIQRNVKWLLDARITDGNKLLGWTYTERRQAPDNSNTQYALLGLHAGRLAGAKIPRAVWVEIRDYYRRTQTPEGGWVYARHHNNHSYLTMDTAGLCGLLIAAMELNTDREHLKKNKRGSYYADNCGDYKEDRNIQRALSWITYVDDNGRTRFDLELKDRTYYNLYGIERAGRLSGQRFLGLHDWYREGCEFLVEAQDKTNGCWPGRGIQFDKWPLLNTSFALLFLSKGRTPVLISKMVHGDDRDKDTDWNNDRNDIKNLVAFASKALFKRQPLAWQVFDGFRGIAGRRGETQEERILNVTSELLQSPIAYFNGHYPPKFKPVEIKLLKQYLDNGGFILAEACCGRPEFDKGMKQLIRDLYPDDPDIELQDLEATHPIWTAFFPVKPGSFKLKAIKSGCKTVLVYSPQDLSCLWEANKTDTADGLLAFRLGANIIAYATGLEMPKVKGSHADVIKPLDPNEKVPRNYLKVAQLKHGTDWQPAPRAMRILLDHLENEVGLNVDKVRRKIRVDAPDLTDYKFMYMHGSKSFSFERKKLEKLKFNLESGGLLFADACCGSKQFDKSFRVFVKELFPDRQLQPIPVEKEDLYSEQLNGEAINEKNIRCRVKRSEGKETAPGYRAMAPALEGIKIDNRWAIIYSKYDIGCALEKHQSTDCIGYDHASALRLGKAAILYALKR
jgi:hypothetical protein